MSTIARNCEIGFAAVLVASLLASVAWADELHSAVKNFHAVSANLFRGAQPSDKGLTILKAHGVRTVVDLRTVSKDTASEESSCKKLGLHYVSFPLTMGTPSKSQVESFLQTVSDPANEPLYVHCRYGADRTGMMMGIYRVVVQHWSYDRAYEEMRKHHFAPFLYHMKRLVKLHEKSTSKDNDNSGSSP